MYLRVEGVSHHTAPVEVRELISCGDEAVQDGLRAVRRIPGVHEAALVSTCNRFELYTVSSSPDLQSARSLGPFLGTSSVQILAHTSHLQNDEAARHLMRVASGLDSLVVGEGQILGQVRNALKVAQQTGAAGPALTGLFQEAIACGRRVRNDTALGSGSFSIGHAAVDLAASIFASLSRASVLVIGAGKMSEVTIRHLVESGASSLIVANRTLERARALASQFSGRAIELADFPAELETADIVIASTSAPHPIITREMLSPIMRRRRGRPLFLIDIAVPRDVDPSVARLENVFLKNIDDLQDVVRTESGGRLREVPRAEEICSEHTLRFLSWYRTRAAVPVIAALRARLDAIREADLALLRGRLGDISPAQWEAIETSTRAMMNHVSREVILNLKQEAEAATVGLPASFDLASAAARLFNLEAAVVDPSPGSAPAQKSAANTAQSDDPGVPPFVLLEQA